ncbi:MAG TPA: hypothetical protein VLX90_05445 [Steroidobacteraceae bacterium]|nr:hypothetical protein [Steroidobacteraceae bacterium]
MSGTSAVNYATIPLSLSVNGAPVKAPPRVRLPGPGDVKTIDRRAFIRTDPSDGADSFEPNYLAMVELATPDLPWMFTPIGANGDRLPPWICLIVVPDGDGVTLTPQAGGPAILRLDSPLTPAAELPDLSQAAAWAHAQISGPDLSTAALNGDSGAALSRLICPRRLQASQRYVACVVPTYRAGVHAGLGMKVADNDLAAAWDSTITAPFSLPVYFSFRFAAGPNGDFASLASQIGPPTTPISAGTRSMDVGQPGFGAAPALGVTLELGGALRAFNMADTTWPSGAQATYEKQLRSALAPPAANDPVVSPPVYGRTQSGSTLPSADGQQPLWLGELNLDPRSRVAAAAGGMVVQAEADAMVASAWDQVGEIRKANQLLRQTQLAREVTSSINRRHLETIAGDGVYLEITSPVHPRVSLTLSGTSATLTGHIAASRIPNSAVSASMRKLARPRGPLGRQLAVSGPQQIVDRLNVPLSSGAPSSGTPTSSPSGMVVCGPVKAPAGMVALDSILPTIQVAKMTSATLATAPGWLRTGIVGTGGTTTVASTGAETAAGAVHEEGIKAEETAVKTCSTDLTPRVPAATEPISPVSPPAAAAAPVSPIRPVPVEPIVNWNGDANVPPILRSGVASMPAPFVFPADEATLTMVQNNFRAAGTAINAYLNVSDRAVADLPSLDNSTALRATRIALTAALDPQLTIKARIGARVPLRSRGDPLEPLSGTPNFPQAMYKPLAALSAEWMLPGISSIPQNSAVLLKTNPSFIEAFMAGLNEEFARELLWRQFPAERNDTWFQNFWADGGTPDIPPIAQFDPAGHLGDHTQDHKATGRVALLVRADLFRRYPATLVSACQLNSDGSLGTRQWPIFQGQFGDDCSFFGFVIADPINAPNPGGGKPGWYFVLEEHISAPRFGLEPSGSVPPADPSWNDLGWDQVKLSGNFLNPSTAPAFTAVEPVTWSENAGAMAYILMRRPVRVAMYAGALIRAEQA